MKKNYFQHDFAAREDPKLIQVFSRYGLEGIGFYWCLIEIMYEQGGSVKVEDIRPIAFRFNFEEQKAMSIVKDFGLFETDDENVWSSSIQRRIAKKEKTAIARRLAANNRWTKERQRTEEEKPSETPEPAKTEKIDYQAIADMWNECCPSLSKIRVLSDERKKKIRVRWNQMKKQMTAFEKDSPADMFRMIFEKLESSDFCNGNNTHGWKADFDWIIDSPNNWQKVMSGRYDNRTSSNNNISTNDKWK